MKLDRRENVLVLTYWNYEDALIQTYTLPYVRMIRKEVRDGKIFMVTLERSGVSSADVKEVRAKLKSEGIEWVPFKYARFGILALLNNAYLLLKLWWIIGQENINTIHSWCTPAGGIGWILSRITGKNLILDSYEPHAEPMVEAGQWDKDSLAFRILFWLEKNQSRHAEVAIGCVSAMEEYAQEKYGAKFSRFYVKPGGVDFELFHPSKRKNKDLVKRYNLEGKTVYVYAGKFGGSYLERETFELLKQAQDFHGDRFGAVLLNNHSEEYIKSMAYKVGLKYDSIVHAYVPHDQVPEYMGLGDVGLVPFVPVPSKRFGSPIKTAEYLSMGIPIIITHGISDDSDFIEKNNLGYVLKELSIDEYKKAVSMIDEARKLEIEDRCREMVKEYRGFDQAELTYKQIYQG